MARRAPTEKREKHMLSRQARNPHARLPPGSLPSGPREAEVPGTPSRHSPPANGDVRFRKIYIKELKSFHV